MNRTEYVEATWWGVMPDGEDLTLSVDAPRAFQRELRRLGEGSLQLGWRRYCEQDLTWLRGRRPVKGPQGPAQPANP